MIEQNVLNSDLSEILLKIQKDLSSGLLYTHSRITYNTQHTLKASSFLYALIELLDEKGILSIEELDEKKKQIAEKLIRTFENSRIGLLYQEPEEDKYSFNNNGDLDCQKRLNTCKAICCKIPFALSKQDVEERVIRWEFGRPYLIAHDADGYCVHIDRKTCRCNSYEHRPVPCRGFDCKKNEKWPVWLDYDSKVINPEFQKQINESNGKFYSCSALSG
ncbi:MAG: YkgJ family cysteine cluster protein [Candidatus Scalindua sp.]